MFPTLDFAASIRDRPSGDKRLFLNAMAPAATWRVQPPGCVLPHWCAQVSFCSRWHWGGTRFGGHLHKEAVPVVAAPAGV